MKFLKKLFRKKTADQPDFCSLLLVAAGTASRMGGIDKVLCELGSIPVIVRAIQPFQESDLIHEIVVVTRRELMVEVGQLCRLYQLTKVTRIIPGGADRRESVQLGLGELSAKAVLVAIHDGARPLITREVLEAAVLRASLAGAAAPGIPVKDTVKLTEGGVVKETLPRERLCAIQTPQVFEVSLIKAALARSVTDGVSLTDDCSAVERLGFTVVVTPGSEENIKLTTPGDLLLGESILAGRDWN